MDWAAKASFEQIIDQSCFVIQPQAGHLSGFFWVAGTGAVFAPVHGLFMTCKPLLFWSYGLHLNQIQRLWSDEIEVKKTILFAEPWHLLSVLR